MGNSTPPVDSGLVRRAAVRVGAGWAVGLVLAAAAGAAMWGPNAGRGPSWYGEYVVPVAGLVGALGGVAWFVRGLGRPPG